jgi:APA family basic amino acid/polyamine antiporter
LVSIGILLAFVTVCIGVLALRKVRPKLPPPFRIPWPIPIAGASALPGFTWIGPD